MMAEPLAREPDVIRLDTVIISPNIDCQVILETICHGQYSLSVYQEVSASFRVMASNRCDAFVRSQLVLDEARSRSGFNGISPWGGTSYTGLALTMYYLLSVHFVRGPQMRFLCCSRILPKF